MYGQKSVQDALVHVAGSISLWLSLQESAGAVRFSVVSRVLGILTISFCLFAIAEPPRAILYASLDGIAACASTLTTGVDEVLPFRRRR